MRYRYRSVDNKDILKIYQNDPYFKPWYRIVRKILKSKEFQKRRLFLHHENESLWTHSIKVSFNSYKFAVKFGINAYNCAIAGLLHDFYVRAWQDNIELSYLEDKYRDRFIHPKKDKFFEQHGFSHPKEALENSRIYFKKYLNDNIENAIITHMFPLSLFTKNKMPNCKESVVVSYVDKKVSINVLDSFETILKYTGLLGLIENKKELQ